MGVCWGEALMFWAQSIISNAYVMQRQIYEESVQQYISMHLLKLPTTATMYLAPNTLQY